MPKLLHSVSHFQFTQNNPKWPVDKTSLTYAFAKNFSETYVPPVVRAFNTSAAASGYFTFARVNDIANADLKISFERGDHGDGGPFDGPYEPIPDTIDLQSVALHEIGHLLGLAHSEDENAIIPCRIQQNRCVRIVRAFNGIVLMVDMDRDMILYNPFTGAVKNIPDPSSHDHGSSNSYAYGFGYGTTVDDLKIVKIHGSNVGYGAHGTSYICDVISLKTRSWDAISNMNSVYYFENGVIIHAH
ncbi:metallopeptidase, catalytic domain-containing protein [Tanacetum coccineum]|uniref:Metallopeptidase, catalytic domain-containing protein n=1 Tax=Tanacetum coccineum TaxID=301880 RepID=A0ABQ5BJ18_9ASTR